MVKIHGAPQNSLSSQNILLKTFQEIPRIRIRVQTGKKKITVSGMDMTKKIPFQNIPLFLGGRRNLQFDCPQGILQKKAPSSQKPLLVASLGGLTGLISLKKENPQGSVFERYRGLLHIVASPLSETCDVVHETDIEDYLASLLAKEMNASWPLAALKAQAVAARTYAIFKIQLYQNSSKKKTGLLSFGK